MKSEGLTRLARAGCRSGQGQDKYTLSDRRVKWETVEEVEDELVVGDYCPPSIGS